MNKTIILLPLLIIALTGCVTERVRTIPMKVGVDVGVGFNPCGSDVEGYHFEPSGVISINCTNGNIYSVRNKQELQQMKSKVLKCQTQGINDYSDCLIMKDNISKK